ncbi:MAG: transcription antitermination factor NusB [Moraxellaceae bacterium]|nr:transcription antitermination factor NusB [Pseudobdellovibrionaceae bacterium]
MRRKSRELALQILFQTEFTPEVTMQDMATVFEKKIDSETMDYTMLLVKGVKQHREKIDARIQEASRHWKIDRMASVDRNILRSAVFEMLHAKETIEPKIVINEAIEIAKVFGTQDSGSFVNGILDQIVRNDRV